MPSKRSTTTQGRHFNRRARGRIAVQRLIDRVQAFALGEPDPHTKKLVTMTSTQLRAALRLIDKVLPDLKAIQFSDMAGQEVGLGDLSTGELMQIAKGGMPERLRGAEITH